MNDVRWTRSGRRGGRGPTATHRAIRSSTLPHFQAPDLSVMETTRLDLNIGPSPPRPPCIHSRDQCSQAFPVFRQSSTPVYYCECKRKVKMREAWEEGWVKTAHGDVHVCTSTYYASPMHTPITHTPHTPCTHHTPITHTHLTRHAHTIHPSHTHTSHTMHRPCTHTWLISSTTLNGQEVMPCRAMR